MSMKAERFLLSGQKQNVCLTWKNRAYGWYLRFVREWSKTMQWQYSCLPVCCKKLWERGPGEGRALLYVCPGGLRRWKRKPWRMRFFRPAQRRLCFRNSPLSSFLWKRQNIFPTFTESAGSPSASQKRNRNVILQRRWTASCSMPNRKEFRRGFF